MTGRLDDNPLIEKLGINDRGVNLVVSAPENFLVELEKQDIGIIQLQADSLSFVEKSFDSKESADYIHLFTNSEDELKEVFPKLRKMLNKEGSLWVSWPKKSAKVESDLSDLRIMKIGMNFGLVDVKVVSIDNIWSGIKFVYRKKDR